MFDWSVIHTNFGEAGVFERIDYKTLNAKQKEIYNFQKLSGVMAEYGFNCIKLSDDWQGADFIACHHNGFDSLKVQLKSRIYIDKKYLQKDIWIAFPYRNRWYIIEHDALVRVVGENTRWLMTDSWIDGGAYSSVSVSSALLKALAPYQLSAEAGASVIEVV